MKARCSVTWMLGILVASLLLPGCSRDSSYSLQTNSSDASNPDASQPTESATESGRAAGSLQQPDSLPIEPSFADQLLAVKDAKSHSIRITREPVSPVQLAQLLDAKDGLTELILDQGVVSDEAADVISQLSSLEHLRLRESRLTDQGAATLASGSLNQLRILNVPQAAFTAAGIAELAKLPLLRQLRLGGKTLDDAAVAAMGQLPELRSLHLIGPKLSDSSLDMIAKMPKLTSFYLDDCPLGDAAWERFFQSRPGIHVHIDQAHHDRDPGRHEEP